MSFYICAVILTELMMIAMTLHVAAYSGFKREQKAWYILTFAAIMICAGAEFAVHCGYYSPKFAIPLTVLTVIQFSIAPLLAMLFTGALGIRNQKKTAIVFFFINFIAETISAPFGWVFYFDNEGYHRGEYFIIYIVLYVISLVYLVVGMIIAGRKFKNRDMITIVMILLILLAGIIPMMFLMVNITYVAIAISASLCYIYYNDLVQQDVQAQLLSNQQKISGMQSHIISGLANLIENRDIDTGGHISRTSAYVKMISEFARDDGIYTDEIDDHFISLIYTLAPMHDIGKIMISDNILKKPGRLTEEEYEQMKKHASSGGDVVREVLDGITDEEYQRFASDIATYHHERWDGTGYPSRLSGADIPLAARIMAIADVYDALISERCYKKPFPIDEAFDIIKKESGSHFDPNLVEVFIRHRQEFENIKI